MNKKVISVVLVCILTLCTISCASAATSKYCSSCNATTSFYEGCYNVWKYNSEFIKHDVNSTTCNYYYVYYKNKQTCGDCGNVYDPNTSHTHMEIHDICGGKTRCPF